MPSTPLKDLLRDSVTRAKMGRSIVAAMMVDQTNRSLEQLLCSFGIVEARACSVREQTLWIECLNGGVGQVVRAQKQVLLKNLQTQFGPNAPTVIRTKIVRQFTDPTNPSL